MNPKFKIVDGKMISSIISSKHVEIENLISSTYLAHHNGYTVNPDSYFLRFPDKPQSRIIALPAHLEKPQAVSGIKWISSFPTNLAKNIPRASAVLILNNHETGYPFACLESSLISAARTAASATLGAYHLNGKKRKISQLGIVGTGFIARYILKFFFGTGWKIDQIYFFDKQSDYAEAFAKRASQEHAVPAHIMGTPESLIAESDLVVFSTTASEPYINDLTCFNHNPLVLHISLRDLSPEVILGSHNVVDDIDHCLKAGTSPHLAEQKVGHRRFINETLPSILAGASIPQMNKPIIFSPFGMGILDLALGNYIYEESDKIGETHEIENFFYDLNRI